MNYEIPLKVHNWERSEMYLETMIWGIYCCTLGRYMSKFADLPGVLDRVTVEIYFAGSD